MASCRSFRPPRLALLALVVAALSGCATAPVPISAEAASRIKRVGVVSLTADQFTRQYTGLTVFGNEREELDISDWEIDRQYEAQIGSELGRLGIEPVPAGRAAARFARVNESDGMLDVASFWGGNWSAIEGETKEFCSENALDAVFVVAEARNKDYMAPPGAFMPLAGPITNQDYGGAGIYARGPMHRVSVVHLVSQVALLDCATGRALATRPLAYRNDGTPADIARSAPMRSVPYEAARAPISDWSPEFTEKMRSDLAMLPARAWIDTLRTIVPAGK